MESPEKGTKASNAQPKTPMRTPTKRPRQDTPEGTKTRTGTKSPRTPVPPPSADVPKYMVLCRRTNCALSQKGVHYHCVDPGCPSLGPLGHGTPYTAEKPYDARRHGVFHDKQEARRHKEALEVWGMVNKKADSLRATVVDKHRTEFRREMERLEGTSTRAPSTLQWRTRLTVGKDGSVGTILASAVERIGAAPLQATTHLPDNVRNSSERTGVPAPGNIIRFNAPDEIKEDAWYALCCGTTSQVEVHGRVCIGCPIRWLELSHVDDSGRRWYELTDWQSTQALECMDEWGTILEFDTQTALFGEETTQHAAQATVDGQTDTTWFERLIKNSNSGDPTREEIRMFANVFRTTTLYYVDADGRALEHPPMSCAQGIQGCRWSSNVSVRGIMRQPLITEEGPLFLRPVRYTCVEHKRHVTAGGLADDGEGQDDDSHGGDPYQLNHPYYRLASMRYACTLLPVLQASYMESLTVAAVQRDLHRWWVARAMAVVEQEKQLQARLGLGTQAMKRAVRAVLCLADYVPSAQSITRLQLVMFQYVVLPRIPEYDKAVAAFDGQLIRIDGTFAASTVVLTSDGGGTRRKKRVGGCVLVAVGLEGLCLQAPTLTPGENRKSMQEVVESVMRRRRAVLGSGSAPVGFCTDTIRRHRSFLAESLQRVYPEMATDEESVLMLQDTSHREWVFTRKIARPKDHPDYGDYVAAIRDVFHQLRVPVNLEETSDQWATRGNAVQLDGTKKAAFLRAVVHHHGASPKDDETALTTLRSLGNAATCAFGTYIPRRVLVRTARRLGVDKEDVLGLFPDHGYKTGEDFLLHLRGVNTFYSKVRSLAGKKQAPHVVSKIGVMNLPALLGRSAARANRRPRDAGVEEADEALFEKGIADKDLTREALESIAHEDVMPPPVNILWSHPVCVQTLAGLMGHKKIAGLQTDETIVEAVNKQLNTNVTQASVRVCTCVCAYMRVVPYALRVCLSEQGCTLCRAASTTMWQRCASTTRD